MSDKFISRWFYSSTGTYDVEVEKGLLKKTTVTEQRDSSRIPDFGDFSNTLRKTYEKFDSDGYDVVNVVPIQMGTSESLWSKGRVSNISNYLGEVGFSITRGAVVIGKKRE